MKRRPLAFMMLRAAIAGALVIGWITFALARPEPLIVENASATLPETSRQVALLIQHGRHAVLPGHSFTVSAPDPLIERQMWDRALAMTSRRTPVHPHSLESRDTDFVIAWGRDRRPAPDTELVVRFDDGAVWKRMKNE